MMIAIRNPLVVLRRSLRPRVIHPEARCGGPPQRFPAVAERYRARLLAAVAAGLGSRGELRNEKREGEKR